MTPSIAKLPLARLAGVAVLCTAFAACGGKVVLDAGGTDGGIDSDAGGSFCTPDAGTLGGVDCYAGCALCAAGDTCPNELGECVAFCIANVEFALHSPCLTQFQAWNACVVGTPWFCGCETPASQACEPLWEPWATCVDDYCPGVNAPGCQPVVAPAVCALGLYCSEAWPCANYIADSPLVCVENVCVAAPCGVGSEPGAGATCCTSDADCTSALPKCSPVTSSCAACLTNADCAALPATPVCVLAWQVCGCNVDTDCTADSYCDTTTVATGICTPGGG